MDFHLIIRAGIVGCPRRRRVDIIKQISRLLKARRNILATSTQPNKLPSRTIMLFTNIANHLRGWIFQPWSTISIRNQKEERNRKLTPLDLEVWRRVERSSWQISKLMVKRVILAPSTPKKQQLEPTWERNRKFHPLLDFEVIVWLLREVWGCERYTKHDLVHVYEWQ